MSEKKFSWEKFYKAPIVGILRNVSKADISTILPLYREVGLMTVEITMNTVNAEEIIKDSIAHFGMHLNIGAGTVCNTEDLVRALDAGAHFIVTPILNEEIINVCIREGIPVFPGAFTPTEIYAANRLGAPLIKVFPMNPNGPQYIKKLKAPLDGVKLMPTGGVHLHNCEAYFEAGATAVGMGSDLFDKALISEKNWSGLAEHFERILRKISN